MSGRLHRRALLQAAGVLGLSAAVGEARGQEVKKPGKDYFGGGMFELLTADSLKPKAYGTNVSPDGLAFTITFGSAGVDALQVALSGSKTTSAVKTAVLRIPFVLPADKRLVGFTQDIRGYVKKTKGARVAVIADLGGSTEVFEFPYGEVPHADDFIRSFITADRREGAKGAPASLYTINLILTAQRQTPQDSVLLAVDSLDVEAILHAPDAPKRTPTPPKKREKK